MLEKFTFTVDPKNIGFQSLESYKASLISRNEDLISRMRWKLFYARERLKKQRHNVMCQDSYAENIHEENYGFRSMKTAPPDRCLKGFEEDLFNIIPQLILKRYSNDVQVNIRKDMTMLQGMKKVLIKSDKTGNWYSMDVSEYCKQMKQLITKDYKQISQDEINEINKEAAFLAKQLGLEDRIDCMALENAFITVKDHKAGFPARIYFRLINPAKSNMGRISKVILSRVNNDIRKKLLLCQWQSSDDTLKWFRKILNSDTSGKKFIQFDIENFYPEITEDLLEKASKWASTHTYLSDLAIKIIIHARRTILFDGSQTWCKKVNSKFDVGMGAFDGAEVSELIGLYMLDLVINTHQVLPRDNFGLYRDDILGVCGGSGPVIERIKKKIVQIFKNEGLTVTAEANTRRVNFLDFVLDLDEKIHKPFHKPNANVVYVNSKSNHPPQVLKNIPMGVELRLSKLSSNVTCFNGEKSVFQRALNEAGYKHELSMKNIAETPDDCRMQFPSQNDILQSETANIHGYSQENVMSKKSSRRRKIIWYNPPYNVFIENNVGKLFFSLIAKHFKKGTFLGKLFNRNNLKLSYGTCPKIKNKIAAHNRKLLSVNADLEEDKCNCQRKDMCPMKGDGPCNVGSVVYLATLTSPQLDHPKTYVGASNNFKSRYYRHSEAFRRNDRKTDCHLSMFVWKCKDKGFMPDIKFSVLKKQSAYSKELKKCFLCIAEKLEIMKRVNDPNNLNERSELMAKCLHRDKFLLSHVNLNGYSPKYAANWKENNQSLNVAELIRPLEGQDTAEGGSTESDQSADLEGDRAGLAENG